MLNQMTAFGERTMKTICVLVSLVFPLAGQAQSAPTVGPSPAFTASGAFFALSVADLSSSTKWYSETLGLRVVMQAPRQNGAAATVLEGGGLIVELVQHDSARPLADAAPGTQGSLFIHGLFKVGVVVENYDKLLETLRARRVEIAFGPFPARGDQRANVIIKDNAGNLIQFFAR
jgi:catechol 2,3-dioxygenase-like lactoylglutathione lyase family enzyme